MNKILHWLTEFHKFLAFYILLNLSLLFLPYLLFIKGSKSNDESYLVLSFVLLVVVSPNGFRGNIINFLIQYKRYFTYTVIVIFLTMGWYFAFGEKNYSDCILNHVKSSASGNAIEVLESACEDKYGHY
jgi:hypothetical protein